MYPYYSGVDIYGIGYGVRYGSISLTESSPPQSFVEPLSLDEVKVNLALDLADVSFDQMVLGFITAARIQAEIAQNRDLVRKQWDLSLDYWPYNPSRPWEHLPLRDPLVSVDLAQYRDSGGVIHPLTEGTDYIVDGTKHPGVLMPPWNSWWPVFTPWPSSAILVRFTAGVQADSVFWSDAGGLLKPGMLYLISQWFNKRLPFEPGRAAIQEFPNTIKDCLSAGALQRPPR